jgi:hypothetical protein
MSFLSAPHTARSITVTAQACHHNAAQARTDLRRAERLELLANLLGIADAASAQEDPGGVTALKATQILEEAIKRFEDAARARALIDASNAVNALR